VAGLMRRAYQVPLLHCFE